MDFVYITEENLFHTAFSDSQLLKNSIHLQPASTRVTNELIKGCNGLYGPIQPSHTD